MMIDDANAPYAKAANAAKTTKTTAARGETA